MVGSLEGNSVGEIIGDSEGNFVGDKLVDGTMVGDGEILG